MVHVVYYPFVHFLNGICYCLKSVLICATRWEWNGHLPQTMDINDLLGWISAMSMKARGSCIKKLTNVTNEAYSYNKAKCPSLLAVIP